MSYAVSGSIRAASLFVLTGCGGSMVKWNEDTVNERLDWLSESLPLCTTPSSSEPPQSPPRWRDASGSCGGDLTSLSEHDNGITDIDITFAAYCLNTDAGPVTLDGRLIAKEIGHPTDYGPEIEALEMEGDGDLAIARDSGTMIVQYGHSRTEYGNRSTWYPDAPDDANPDRTDIDEVRFEFPDQDGRVSYWRNLEFERTSGSPATLHIRGGIAGTEGEGDMEISTPEDEPLVFQSTSPMITSGAIVLSGKGGTEVVMRPVFDQGIVFDITLNGETFERRVDCAAAGGPVSEFMTGVFGVLPIPLP